MEQKFDISERQDIKGLLFDIPCRFRAQCYIGHLKVAIDELLSDKNIDCNWVDKKSVCTDIVQELIDLLDQRVIDSVNADLEKNSEINSHLYKNINPVCALIRYYEDNGGKKYDQYLIKCDPNLEASIEELTTNFLRVNARLMKRITNDFETLRNHFLTTLTGERISLVHIHFTDSDRHHFGQQVCILEFTDLNINTKQCVVYKPKPCTSSAFLVGNLRKLEKIDQRFKENHSLNELVNNVLSHEDQLKTYLIYPCVDLEHRSREITAVPIDNHYGYVEYITHEPWRRPKVHQILSDVYLEFSSRKNYQSRELSQEVDKRTRQAFVESLRESAQATSSDFIITQNDDWKRYSRACGIYTMMFILAGLTDIHHGNIIMCKGLPVPIDTEICMSNMPNTIQAVGCLNSDNGAMRSKTMKPSNLRVLKDINGIFVLNVKMLESNRLYRLYRRVNNNLIACNLIMQDYFEGIERCLACISHLETTSQLTHWSKSPLLQEAFVRVIPFETAVFSMDLLRVRMSGLPGDEVSKMINRFLDNRLLAINLDEEEEVKNNMVYLPDNSEYLQREYQLCSIPCYWAKINNTKLYSGDSSVVLFPENPILFAKAVMQNDIHNYRMQQQYSLKSPQQTLLERISYLGDRHNHPVLLSSLSHEEEVTIVSKQPQNEHEYQLAPDYNYFSIIDLEGSTPRMLKDFEEGYHGENEDSSEKGNSFG